jgi:hypothetical protein
MAARACSDFGADTEKRSLASIIRAHGTLAVTDAIDITLDICEVLAHAHLNGVVHGDLGLQRVRTDWPRRASSRVEIFGHRDEAEAFGAIPIMSPPEQREGRAVDRRADVWAVGALLSWMLSGGVRRVQSPKLPGSIRSVIVACLADAPEDRPQSVDEVSEVLGSFASSPARRFEHLARRRALAENATRVRRELGDVDHVLGRLDDMALAREMSAPARIESEKLVFAIERGMGSAVFQKAERLASFDDDEGVFDTEIAVDAFVEEDASHDVEVSITQPLSLAPVVVSAESDAAPAMQGPTVPLPVMTMTAPPAFAPAPALMAQLAPEPRKSSRALTVLTAFGVLVAISLGLGIGTFGGDRWAHDLPWTKSAPAAQAPAADPAPAKEASPPVASVAPPASVVPSNVPMMSASALPDARVPEARPAPLVQPPPRPRPPRAPAAASTSSESSEPFELSPSSLSDAL